ncbi:unnamed protein product, partial [Gulo gulo]
MPRTENKVHIEGRQCEGTGRTPATKQGTSKTVSKPLESRRECRTELSSQFSEGTNPSLTLISDFDSQSAETLHSVVNQAIGSTRSCAVDHSVHAHEHFPISLVHSTLQQ